MISGAKRSKALIYGPDGLPVKTITLTNDEDQLQSEEALVTASALFGRANSTAVRPLQIDAATHTLQTINYAHRKIHAGSSYWSNIADTNINSNPLRFKLATPNTTKWVHMLVFGVSSGESTFTVTEAPTGGATGGTVITPTNRNRNSLNTSDATVTKGVSAPTGGTVLGGEPELHGFDKDKIAGETRSSAEIILKQNTTYVFELESGTSDVVGNLLLDWYEHTDKD